MTAITNDKSSSSLVKLATLLALVVALVVLSGCSPKTKRTLGIDTPIPNEYQIQTYKPLEMPPHMHIEEGVRPSNQPHK